MPDPALSQSGNPFYARGDIAARYDRSRGLPADVQRQWAEVLARHAGPRPRLCVDLGCGTGRFTRILVEATGGRVIGIDPSGPMLRAAAESLRGTPGVTLLHGRAEAVPLAAGCADFLLMSLSYHHVPDKPAALASVRRTLAAGGVFCLCTHSLESLDASTYQRFFPESRRFDELRFPPRDAIAEQIRLAGFTPRAFEVVRQRVADDLRGYRANVAMRAHSDLQAVTDEQFARGLARLDEWVAGQVDRPVFDEVDVFTFTPA